LDFQEKTMSGDKQKKQRKGLRRFLREDAGSTAAIDSIRINREQTSFAAAVDTAALAVASSPLSDLTGLSAADKASRMTQLNALAKSYVDGNYDSTAPYGPVTSELTINGQVIDLKAAHTIPMTLTSLLGITNATLHASSQVTKGQPPGSGLTKVEIAMVLDTTGSMAGSKITSLKSAANKLKDIVFGVDNATNPDVKLAVVPFSTAVNVGSQYATAPWIDSAGDAAQSRVNFTQLTGAGGRRHNMWAWNALGRPWPGCVEMRSGAYGKDDTTPISTDPDTLFTPMFAPDEPSSSTSYSYVNSYMADGVSNSSTDAVKQKNPSKYTTTATISTTNGKGPDYGCHMAPIVPLTSTKASITTGIAALNAAGSTIISEGLAWGWRVLSPSAPFTEGVPYAPNNDGWQKILVLMTDGQNDLYGINNINGSDYNAPGYLAQNRLGSTTEAGAEAALNTMMSDLCTQIKNKQIIVYTIGFQIPNQAVRTLLTNCATDPQHYMEAVTDAELVTAFERIGSDLADMYLSK
jgi:hypothetical protein